MDGQNQIKNKSIQVISRAADILRVLGRDTGGQSLGQIAKQVQLPRSTVQRIVSALSEEGLISIEKGNSGIKLGPEILSLAQACTSGFKDRLRPMLKQISERTGETVDLAVLENGKMRFVDQVVGSQRLRTVSSIGESFPLTTTANGKAALACLDLTEAMRLIISEFDEQPHTTRPMAGLLAELGEINAGALATDAGEHTEEVSAFGFAIQDPAGEIYAISVPVPTSRFERTKTELAQTITDIRDTLDLPL